MSGRRSEALSTHPLGHPQVYSLTGGVLGWGAAGLALSGLSSVEAPPVASLQQLERELVSCFVAESVETLLALDLNIELIQNPRQEVLDRIEARRAMGSSHYRAIEETLHELGRVAWHRGHPIDKIAVNIDRMSAMLKSLPAS